ncbi:hypothetical protein Avbf_11911 [Armadillidium vulgare]|nr:hypothetical protein Avbf_11911 [Armadillidium vulgare]
MMHYNIVKYVAHSKENQREKTSAIP